MSHIGAKPIIIPEGITVSLTADKIIVKSASSELQQAIPAGLKLEKKDNQLLVVPQSTSRQTKALYGLLRSLVNNLVIGLTQGYTKTLELQGTGYRVNQQENKSIELSLGYSHPVVFSPPPGIKLEVKENKYITVSGADKQLVGQVAADIRAFRRPDVYKGKGIRYLNEQIKLKPGKAAKATEV